jgi:ABC-2 type transport system permease protein
VRPYLAFASAGFARYSAYRAASVAGAFTNTVFGVVKASITTAAIGAAGGALAGYDAQQGATYAWLVPGLLASVALLGCTALALRTRSGDVAVDLQLSWLAADLGRAAFMLLPRGVPPVVIGLVFFDVALPTSALPYLLALVSLTLAVVVSFACRFALNLVAFWLLDLRGAITLYVVASNVLAGLIVPVHWFPGWMRTVAELTPFPSMLQAPVDVLSGRDTGWTAVATICVQVVWVVLALGTGRIVLARATRKLVVQGG